MTAPTTDRPQKLARVMRLLADRDATELLLTAPENLAWFFDGARVQVPYGGAPVLTASIGRDGGIRVSAFANEVDRLAVEELDGIELRPVPWSASLPDPAPGGLRDTDAVGELRALRASLLPAERARYRAFGRDVAQAVTTVLRDARPEQSERELAARLAHAVVALGAEPVVLLVGGHSRRLWRHPLPTDAPLGRRAMAVVGARRHGLVINLSRWVRFGPAEPGEAATDAALLEVEADAFAATRPGRTLGDALDDIRSAYLRHGFGPDEWLRHHQGGPTGYLGRDPRATPGGSEIIASGQAFAWNPTAPGAKVEDTVIIDTDGVDVLTVDPAWPTTTIRGLPRPTELEL